MILSSAIIFILMGIALIIASIHAFYSNEDQ